MDRHDYLKKAEGILNDYGHGIGVYKIAENVAMQTSYTADEAEMILWSTLRAAIANLLYAGNPKEE